MNCDPSPPPRDLPVYGEETDARYSIEVIAELAGVNPQTVLHYQEQGFIRPAAHDGGDADLFDAECLRQLRRARPVQAAFASAGSFTVGAVLLLLLVFFVPRAALTWTVSGSSLLFLALLGAVAAHAGGSSIGKSVARVTFWGALAMALTAAVGALFGTTL